MSRYAFWGALILSCGGSGTPAPQAALPPHATTAASNLPPDPEPWRMTRPVASATGELRFPAAEQTTLGSGLSLMLLHKAAPVASVHLVFRHGAAACPPGKSGLAALTARMLTEGTRAHPGLKLAEAVEQLGATLDEDAGRDATTLSLSVLTQDLPRAMALLGEVVQEPAFLAVDFERVRNEWLDGLRTEQQSPEHLASLTALDALFEPPHGRPAAGIIADVRRLSLDDLRDFHRKAYRAGDASLIVVGDATLQDVRKSAEQAFGKLSKGRQALEPPVVPRQPPPPKQILLIDRPGAAQSALVIAQPLPKRSAPGFETRELLSSLLGGLFTSRLNLNLREKHAYTYGAHAQNVATLHWGALFVTSSVRSDVTAEALLEASRELARAGDPRLGAPISQAELARARAALIQSLGARLERGARMASTLSEAWSLGLAADYYQRYPTLLAAETTEGVTRAAAQLQLARPVIVIVGDRSLIEAPLTRAGFLVVAAPTALTD